MTNKNLPFADWDPFKLMGEFKMPGFDLEAMMSAHRKNVDALTKANQAVFEGMRAVAERQAEIMRKTMEEYSAAMQELMSADPATRAGSQGELARKAFEQGLDNMRELAEMIIKSQNEAFEAINARMQESLKELQGQVDKARSGK